jgi:hypothetical protein
MYIWRLLFVILTDKKFIRCHRHWNRSICLKRKILMMRYSKYFPSPLFHRIISPTNVIRIYIYILLSLSPISKSEMFSSFPSAIFQKAFSPLFYSNSPSSCKSRSPRNHIKQIPLIELIEHVLCLFKIRSAKKKRIKGF